MSELDKQARAVIEAVARSFSPTWNPSEYHIIVAGKRVGLQAGTLKRLSTGKDSAEKIRLRFDKVAARVITRLQAVAREIVPDGMTTVVTITAPIRLASKTTKAVEEILRSLLARKRQRSDESATIHGNRVWVRILRNESERAPKLVGFVHNADSGPSLLLDITEELLELFAATQHKAGSR